VAIHVFGIRHHGPGSARTLVRALESLSPDVVLIEGPPEADAAIPLAADPAMRPPVALLVYPIDAPRRAVFYPFAVFSPEWQAIRFALERRVPVRFMDLSMSVRLARPEPDERDEDVAETRFAPSEALELLARAAGYNDHELWWEQQVERRLETTTVFDAISEAIQAARAEADPIGEEDAQREAAMRQQIRGASKEGFERIAVVCGAWHAPALRDPGPAKADTALLKGLATTKVAATWIPWTYSRLSYRSGYGAGVESPGWYHHLWTAGGGAPIRWLVETARLLREKDLEASSASVIEAVRLAEALASMRDLHVPGLMELRESTLSVMCHGHEAPMHLIRTRLEIGGGLGSVPEGVPTVPLARDLRAQQKQLRLTASDEVRELDLDLRRDTDRNRSLLFHRLRLLDLNWATPHAVAGKAGTFHELWALRWLPEMEVALVENSVWGHTIEEAAGARVRHDADTAQSLGAVAALLDRVILSELPAAVDHVIGRVQACLAVATDVQHLMVALPPLARVVRYGDVRRTPAEHLEPVITGLFERIVIGLLPACLSLDDGAAAAMLAAIDDVQAALDVLDRADQRERWGEALRHLVDRDDDVHGLLRGRSCRLLFEQQRIDGTELARLAGLALSPAVAPIRAAAWIEGLLRGSGQVLLHQDGVWVALDGWLTDLTAEGFREMLPLLRRSFAGFAAGEREAMGRRVRSLRQAGAARQRPGAPKTRLDARRAEMVLPVLAHLLGVPYEQAFSAASRAGAPERER
jgi:hypothetical protein